MMTLRRTAISFAVLLFLHCFHQFIAELNRMLNISNKLTQIYTLYNLKMKIFPQNTLFGCVANA